MGLITCPSCEELTSSEFSFCTNCHKQVKCLNAECKKLLVSNQTICLYCGQSLKEAEQKPQSNRFIRHIDRKSQHSFTEHIEIDMTDHAVDSLAPFITGQIVPPNFQHQDSPSRVKRINEKQLSLGFEGGNSGYNGEANNNQDDSDIEVPANTPPVSGKDSTGAYQFFEKDNDKVVATVKDFKGNTWKEQQRRFILLYTDAYFHYFQKPAPADVKHYKKAAEAAAVYEFRHFTSYLNQVVKELFVTLTDGYKLNPLGIEEVRKIIKEMKDSSVPSGDKYWERSNTAPPTNIARLSKEELDEVKSWTSDEVNLGKLVIGDINKGIDYVVVALWIITVKLQKKKAIQWSEAYEYLKHKYTTISVKRDGFRKAAFANTASEFIEQTSEGLLYLKTEGVKRVEKLIAGS